MAETIRDMQGNVIGYQERDGTLRDKTKKKIGYIKLRNGTVFDSHNQEVGFIDDQGTIVDRYRRRVGSISSDGTVQDWHGIPVYTGSAGPLLLDFEGGAPDPLAGHMEFDELARHAPAAQEAKPDYDALSPRPSAAARAAGVLVHEGFVSPSVVGCLAIVGAVIVGSIILFIFRNPSFLTARDATPTSGPVADVPVTSNQTGGTPQGTPVAQTATPKPLTGKVNTDVLNLRKGPTTDFAILARLPIDTQVVLTGRLADKSWLQVTVPSASQAGWVSSQYIDTDIDISTLPVLPVPAQ